MQARKEENLSDWFSQVQPCRICLDCQEASKNYILYQEHLVLFYSTRYFSCEYICELKAEHCGMFLNQFNYDNLPF